MVAAAKAALRTHLRATRGALTRVQRTESSTRIAAACRRFLATSASSELASYLALPDEVDLGDLHRWWWSLGRPLWLPRVVGPRQLTWHPVMKLSQTRSGAYGISEPDPLQVPAAELPPMAVVLVPGIGFTADGWRLGQGGGFYDAVLVDHPGPTIGVAFACQRLTDVPREEHDRSVQQVFFGD